MASVYILFSFTAGKYYTGVTKDLEKRIEYHLSREFRNSYTAKYSDWELYLEISDLPLGTALKMESHIKRMKSKNYIQNLKKYPEMVEKLISKYR
ncbi:MAG: GIY-YIG nuclease family protein [Flavobacteriales bacterium]|nr:GIY-YIG nuclease family protein [Flavobacteriales bacterium]MBX7096015.1 GIY-YIG nuclease family protein [Flavobacteriales bacterium]